MLVCIHVCMYVCMYDGWMDGCSRLLSQFPAETGLQIMCANSSRCNTEEDLHLKRPRALRRVQKYDYL
jgi:hypothetical protein